MSLNNMIEGTIEYENLYWVNQWFFEEYKIAFETILQSGRYVLGNSVKKFEQEFAKYCGTKYCIGVANGLDALFLSLKVLDLKPGDEVLVPSNTYIATILSIVQNNLKPILIEPDIYTYNMDPTKIEEKISPKTKAIMVTHLYGKLSDMNAIGMIAKKYNLKVIEDCAQSHGASYKNIKAGNFGDFWAFSFYPTKNLGALGDAWAVTCNNEDYKTKIATLRNYGSKIKYSNEMVWYNSRLDELQAALLSVKLQKLDMIIKHKRELAQLYLDGLKEDFIKPQVDSDYFDVFHIFAVRHPQRTQLREYLLRNNIKTEVHYPIAPNKQQAMIGILDKQKTPIAQEVHNTILSLPISTAHSRYDIERVIEVMNTF